MVLSDKILGIMIELCTKKCMAIFTVIMLLVTIVVLVIENEFSVSHAMRGLALTKVVGDSHSKQCWLHEKFDIKKECTYCTDFEKKSKADYCEETGFKMLIKCENSGSKWKSCTSPKDPYIETRSFWLFEFAMLVMAAISFLVVRTRRKNLDKLLMEKINRQIASGV